MDYFWPCLVFVWATYLWESYLDWRQRKVYRDSDRVPDELSGVISDENFQKSRRYQLDKSTYNAAYSLFKHIEFLLLLLFEVFPLAWTVSEQTAAVMGYGPEYEVLISVLFLLVFTVYSKLTSLPWLVYYTFVLEEKHGFNNQTLGFFIKDQIKSFLLQLVLISAIMAGLIATIRWGGDNFFLYAWFFTSVVLLVFVVIYHDLIAPIFDTFTPLPEGELKTAIEDLASSLGFPLKKLFIVEGSKRSAHSNAYFYGFWNSKCIVLFDTLLEKGLVPDTKDKEDVSFVQEEEREEQESTAEMEDELSSQDTKQERKGCNMEEVLAVLGHELGHWKYWHVMKNLCVVEANLFLCFFMFGYFLHQQDMYASFGFPDSRPVLIGIIVVFQLIFLPYHLVFNFVVVQLGRRYEYQADKFAQNLGKAEALCSALVKLVQDNLSFPIADPLYSRFNHIHPTMLERIRTLRGKKKTD